MKTFVGLAPDNDELGIILTKTTILEKKIMYIFTNVQMNCLTKS